MINTKVGKGFDPVFSTGGSELSFGQGSELTGLHFSATL